MFAEYNTIIMTVCTTLADITCVHNNTISTYPCRKFRWKTSGCDCYYNPTLAVSACAGGSTACGSHEKK